MKICYEIDFILASTGGLLSLCLGFSLLSVLEIFYFFTIRVCIRSYRKYQRGKLSPQANSSKKFVFSQSPARVVPLQAWTSIRNELNFGSQRLLLAPTSLNYNNENRGSVRLVEGLQMLN